ncbi:MAG TPA: type I methionyl aminopeptidase [Thermoanaerobaculia bacterium]|nr:type I methionyl aminopeptidase [Thermoanaerobaculia bacterium]
MTIRGASELEGVREAGRVVSRILHALVRETRAGVTTAELDAVAARLLAEEGARSAPELVYGFPGSACISINEEIVHGVPGRRTLRSGDVVKLDVTVEKGGFMADAARTVVLPIAAAQKKRLATCARAAFSEAMRVARVGYLVRDIGAAIEGVATRYGFAVVRDLNGHGIGRTIHEEPTVPGYYDPERLEPLHEGMVLAIEPILCAGSGDTRLRPDGWTVVTSDGSLAVHHENTIVVRDGAPLILTAA